MALPRPVVVQHHGHLTLTLDFQGQILKMLYLEWESTTSIKIAPLLLADTLIIAACVSTSVF